MSKPILIHPFSKFYKNNKEKRYAHGVISVLIQRGKIIKSICKINDKSCCGRIEAHHQNYSKPLEVIWLCRSHHIRLHRREIILNNN